ncbi:MAG: hypothetical protein LBQ01_05200 [Prevotellaceae bacterium]|jgi:hypothetical protein|nr:hypothetical protein [Prevotellaceae bacterium]
MRKILISAVIVAAMLAADISAAQDSSRGVKREKEECEELALMAESNPRASANAVSLSEAIAYKMAMTEARAELAAQIAAEITGFVRHRIEQYQMTAGANTDFTASSDNLQGHVTGDVNKPRTISAILEADSSATVQRVSQIIANTRPVCKNSYDRADGSVQVYVCIEMGLPAQRQVYKQLKEDGLIDVDVDADGTNDVDFAEKEFLLELAKAREEYNARKNGE